MQRQQPLRTGGALAAGPSQKLQAAINNHSTANNPRIPNAVKLAAANGTMDPGFAAQQQQALAAAQGAPAGQAAAAQHAAQMAAQRANYERQVAGWRQQHQHPQQAPMQQQAMNAAQQGASMPPQPQMMGQQQQNPFNQLAYPRALGFQFNQMPQQQMGQQIAQVQGGIQPVQQGAQPMPHGAQNYVNYNQQRRY